MQRKVSAMFCPNCGKDCKDFKFCPDCGRDLQEITGKTPQEITEEQSFEKRREALENAGKLYCPDCLSVNVVSEEIELAGKEHLLYRNAYVQLVGTIVNIFLNRRLREEQKKGPRNECLDCGCWWYPKLQGLVNRYRPYLEGLIGDKEYVVFTGEGGKTLTLAWNSLIIDSPDGPKKSALHPYVTWYWDLHSIKQVIHTNLTDEPEPRWLTICNKKNKRWSPPGTPELAAKMSNTILYERSQIAEFRKIKDALNGIIEENKKAGLL